MGEIMGFPETHPHLEGQGDDWEASDQWIMSSLLSAGKGISLEEDHFASHYYDIPKLWLNAYSPTEDNDKVGEWEKIEAGLEGGEEGESQIWHPGWQPRCHIHFPGRSWGDDLVDQLEEVEAVYEAGRQAWLESGKQGASASFVSPYPIQTYT